MKTYFSTKKLAMIVRACVVTILISVASQQSMADTSKCPKCVPTYPSAGSLPAVVTINSTGTTSTTCPGSCYANNTAYSVTCQGKPLTSTSGSAPFCSNCGTPYTASQASINACAPYIN